MKAILCPEAIPQELKEWRSWVCWQPEMRNSKLTKVPFTIWDQYASVHNPSTWATFDEVLEDGRPFGYVFSEDDEFTGIDLDHCRDPATGKAEPWALDIVNSLASYTEASPSGTGAHIIIKAQLAGRHHRRDGVEIYDRKRFFTITGGHIKGTPTTIESRQPEVDALVRRIWPEVAIPKVAQATTTRLDDDEVRGLALNARNGQKFIDLYITGDISAYNHDDSRADLALCRLLAFYTQDADQLDRLFRDSALYRDKWERDDYRERTLNKAVTGLTATFG